MHNFFLGFLCGYTVIGFFVFKEIKEVFNVCLESLIAYRVIKGSLDEEFLGSPYHKIVVLMSYVAWPLSFYLVLSLLQYLFKDFAQTTNVKTWLYGHFESAKLK